MNRITGISDMILCRVQPEVRAAALEQVIPSLDVEDLVDVAARESTPSDVLEVLARSPHAKVRQAVALNLLCPPALLESLSADKAKTVSATAQRHLFWAKISAPDAAVPEHSPEYVAMLEKLFQRDHPWSALKDSDEVLARLLLNDDWIADSRFVRWCYESSGVFTDDTVKKIGPSRFARALVKASPQKLSFEEPLEWLWESLSTDEFLSAIQDNADIIEPRLDKELGSKWRKAKLNAFDGHLPYGWSRVGLASCPDAVLLEALDSESELLLELASANARTRAHLHGDVIKAILRDHEEEGYLRWELIEALSDDALLDLPVELISEYRVYGDDVDRIERVRTALALAVGEIASERPEVWSLLSVLGDYFEGSSRELLAALRSL